MGYFLNRKFLMVCRYGTREEVGRLLRKGADIGARDRFGYPAIYLAAEDGNVEVIQLLIERNADLNVKMDGGTPLTRAIKRECRGTAELLMQHGAIGRDGWTTLHCAAAGGYYDTVQMLLDKGADVHARNDNGKTPRDVAIESGYHAIADLLREKPEPVLLLPSPVESGWKRTPEQEEVTLVTDKKDIGYRLTDIFNFEERMYTRISRNLETNAESQSLRFFDEFNDTAVLETAHRELVQRGGITDVSVIRNAILRK